MNEYGGIASGKIPQAAWEAAGRPDQPGYREALMELLGSIVTLPGVVSVRVPNGKLSDPAWNDIVLVTLPTCLCGHRRLLLPLIQHDWEPTGADQLVTIDADNPLELAPWGGDWQSTLLRLTVDRSGGFLNGNLLPHEQAFWPVRHPDWPDGQHGFHSLASLSVLCAEPRRVIFGVPCGNSVYAPFCSVEEIDERQGRVQVRVSPWVTLPDEAGSPGHICEVAATP